MRTPVRTARSAQIWLYMCDPGATLLQRKLHDTRPTAAVARISSGHCRPMGGRLELLDEMGVTLARRSTGAAGGSSLTSGRRPKLMEKFVIEGGVPLSGTMVADGNKKGEPAIFA